MASEKLLSHQYVPSWEQVRWPEAEGEPRQPTLVLKDDDIFLVTDRLGNITSPMPGEPETNRISMTGLFCQDTRFLSRGELQIEGRSLVLLGSEALSGGEMTVSCTNPSFGERIPLETLGIFRHLVLRGGLFEEIEVTNYNSHPISVQLSFSVDADFRDLFEVRQYQRRSQRGRALVAHPDLSRIQFAYEGLDGEVMESEIDFQHRLPDGKVGNTAIWQLTLDPHVKQTLGYRVRLLRNRRSSPTVAIPNTLSEAKQEAREAWNAWRSQTAQPKTDDREVDRILTSAQRDLYVLRQSFGEEKVLAAGIPWFSTLFGRDSIIAAWQTLMFDPLIARDTLKILARYQGRRESDWHDEDPGKILHELRLGEMARCEEIPHTPYYGTVDATPLWLVLLSDYYAWTGDVETLRQLWDNAVAAMEWIDATSRETGYLTYWRRSDRGIDNQGWKDSGNCIVDLHGKRVSGPIALCEVQAYVYAAKIRSSELAAKCDRPDLQQRWRKDAEDLKRRFNRDFWLEDESYCALALDGDGNPVDSLTSNPGHCLFAEILDDEKAQAVGSRLMQPDLFSGWGIRTLSSQSPAYNPIGYHLGSVWPHDNAIAALGLRRIGHLDSALKVAQAMFDMTRHQSDGRPPELFCGLDRHDRRPPVPYPVACSPQAWATGTVFQMLQVILNPVPDAENRRLTLRSPSLLPASNHLKLYGITLGSATVDLAFDRVADAIVARVLKRHGDLTVAIELP
ncbi:amylo-alpha-1,6-glucosidase [Baaleninema simplex]|uniref:amylo-alpha-1,6-glucosidase n=1 Tax=Baaleninema simplex TaxID=2862350 RepID=UPI000346DE79|nr:amylo-alpha-1,6-glucosidase [Baaleninema simplex]